MDEKISQRSVISTNCENSKRTIFPPLLPIHNSIGAVLSRALRVSQNAARGKKGIIAYNLRLSRLNRDVSRAEKRAKREREREKLSPRSTRQTFSICRHYARVYPAASSLSLLLPRLTNRRRALRARPRGRANLERGRGCSN